MLFEITLTDHITVEQLERLLGRVERTMDSHNSSEKHLILMDASEAKTYESAARSWFTKSWGPRNKHRVDKIAIVTERVILRMAVTTSGLVAGYRIDAFATVEGAQAWLKKS